MSITYEQIKEVMVNEDDEFSIYADGSGGYDAIEDLIGEVLHSKSIGMYQGDTIVLYRKDGKFGILVYGWGSCSYCDALEACDAWGDVHDLATSMEESVLWMDKSECAEYLTKHDWEGDWIPTGGAKRFAREAIKILEEVE